VLKNTLMHMNKCEVCGKTFASKRKSARFCQDKSTCRVTHARKQKQAQEQANRMTVPLELFKLYETVTTLRPQAKPTLDHILLTHGQGAFNAALYVACDCINGGINAIN